LLHFGPDHDSSPSSGGGINLVLFLGEVINVLGCEYVILGGSGEYGNGEVFF
jgi:hypothetical protein